MACIRHIMKETFLVFRDSQEGKLLDNEELLDYIYHYRYSAQEIARAMHTDINLVALKIAHLNELGYDLRPLEHRSNFLK